MVRLGAHASVSSAAAYPALLGWQALPTGNWILCMLSRAFSPLEEKIYTYPVLHYQNGGLTIDVDSQTTVEGLYACGEIAGGTHGKNRMMGNSLLECCVFGRRAGRAAAEKASA